MYTGGTTGLSKGVMLSHANLYINALSAVAAVARPAGAVGLVVAPFFHVAGCGLALQMMQRLVTQVVVPMFDEAAVLQAIQAERVTETFLVPTMIRRLIEHPRFAEFDLSSLGMLLYGAAPMDVALLDQAMRALPRAEFCQAYGMTELAPTISVLLPADHRPGPDQARRLRSAGRPVPIAEVRIVDGQGRELPPGAVGEISARGPMVMRGYWNKPLETAAALRDGWMHTGDGGYMDADGYLYVVDRLKDMIVTGGENVYSAEVENALAQLPQVSMCAVIGVPDDKWGERVHAVVVLRAGAELDEAAVLSHCRDLIAGYKCPRSVEFRTELPLSPAGKLQKFLLREPFWAGRERRVN
jgi:acyl-CoA synthetase (AMP-forming)/AMP-acid ligase II